MKRSEMINKVSDKLILVSPVPLTEEEATRMATDILDLVEREGMRAPSYMVKLNPPHANGEPVGHAVKLVMGEWESSNA